VCSRSNLHLLSNQGQRLLCAETARRAKCDGEAGQRILGLTGNAIDGDLKATMFLLCSTNVINSHQDEHQS